jgi:hypothetical protein
LEEVGRNPAFLEKWLISGVESEISKMSLELLTLPESEEVFKNN